jgi:hypothetical protein
VTVRTRLAEDLEGQYDVVRQALEDAMGTTKKQWLTCTHCQKRSEVDVVDNSARIRAIELWLEQGFGKPGTTSTAPVA